ncbi:MAG TPA: hypothetical protein PKA48_05655 [Candidatus Obscuribacter sp.]|nr:hypothetical protein [Candidatus Obscuribacter sp.]
MTTCADKFIPPRPKKAKIMIEPQPEPFKEPDPNEPLTTADLKGWLEFVDRSLNGPGVSRQRKALEELLDREAKLKSGDAVVVSRADWESAFAIRAKLDDFCFNGETHLQTLEWLIEDLEQARRRLNTLNPERVSLTKTEREILAGAHKTLELFYDVLRPLYRDDENPLDTFKRVVTERDGQKVILDGIRTAAGAGDHVSNEDLPQVVENLVAACARQEEWAKTCYSEFRKAEEAKEEIEEQLEEKLRLAEFNADQYQKVLINIQKERDKLVAKRDELAAHAIKLQKIICDAHDPFKTYLDAETALVGIIEERDRLKAELERRLEAFGHVKKALAQYTEPDPTSAWMTVLRLGQEKEQAEKQVQELAVKLSACETALAYAETERDMQRAEVDRLNTRFTEINNASSNLSKSLIESLEVAHLHCCNALGVLVPRGFRAAAYHVNIARERLEQAVFDGKDWDE